MTKGSPDKDGNIIYPFQFNGGVNTLMHPTAIQDNQMVRCANMFPDESGILMKRPGVSHVELIDLEIAGGSYAIVYFPLNLFLPDAALGYKYLKHYFLMGEALGDDLDERVTLFNADTAHFDARPSIVVGTGGESTDPLSFVNYANKTLIVGARNLTEGLYYWRAADGGGVQDFTATFVHTVGPDVPNAQTQSVTVKPKIACTYQGRVWYFNFGVGMGHWAVAADATTPNHTNNGTMPVFTVIGNDALSFNGRHIELDASGENIVLAREIMLMSTGSPAQSSLLIVTDKGSCFLGTGVLPETFEDPTTNPITLTFQKINYKVGCCAFNTMVHTPYGYMWADGNEVWVLSGNVPVKVGTLIGNELAKYPVDARKWWSAGYVDYKYVLQCVSDRGTDDKYLQREQWWLDLTNGLPAHTLAAKWYGPMKVARDVGLEEDLFAGIFGDGPYLSGIMTDFDGQRIIGLCTDGHYQVNSDTTAHGLSLVDYTSNFGVDDIPFKTITGGNEWAANTVYAVGDIVRPGFNTNIGALFICTTAGTSGNTEPVWNNASATDTTTDNTITWTDIRSAGYRFLDTSSDTYLLLNSMDIRTKEFVLGRPETDKVMRSLDLLAFSSIPQLITARTIRNQGANNLGRGYPLAALFGQDANAFKLGVADLDVTPVTHGQLEGKSLRPLEGQLQRFKSVQFNLFDGLVVANILHPNENAFSPIIIDASSNALVFAFYETAQAHLKVFQATLTLNSNGYMFYANMDALLSAITVAMNTAVGAGGLYPDPTGGKQILIQANAFGYTLGNAGTANPLFNNIHCLSLLKDAGTGWALLYGDSNALLVDGGLGPASVGTFDLLKSKRLMAILGMNTRQDVVATGGGSLPAGVYVNVINTALENITDGVLKIWASEIMPSNYSSNIYLTEGVIRARTTTTDPLSFSNR